MQLHCPARACARGRFLTRILSGKKGGWLHRLLVAASVAVATMASAEPVRIPPSLADLALVEVDSVLGIAVLQSRSGAYRTMKAGEQGPDAAFRLVRLYKDRVEVEVAGSGSAPGKRFWLWKAAPGGAAPNLTPLSVEAPDSPIKSSVAVEANSSPRIGR